MLDVERYLGRLEVPSYADPGRLAVEALRALRPARRISVPDWAELPDEGRRIRTPVYSGPWRNDFAPYMTEPSRMTTSRKFRAVGFCGPARTVKTDSLVLNTIGHRVCCMPRFVKVICPTQDAARAFSREKVSPMIRSTPSVADRLLKVRNADTIHDKHFEGGMSLRIAWPVIGELSMLDIPDIIVTDYDRIGDNIDGEGSLFDLALKRIQTFGSLGKAVFESSPGKIVTDTEWVAKTPHEAPPCTGILSIFNAGTRGKVYWQCPHCNEPFQPLFSALHYEKRSTPGETAKTVAMVCPMGCVIDQSHKIDMNRAGFWLHETNGGDLVEIDDPAVRDTDIASYWCEGPVAAMQSWEQLVQRYEEGVQEYEQTNSDEKLKATVTLDQGRPYQLKVITLGEGLDEKTLKAQAQPYPLEIVPAGARFLTVQVDVQAHRFVIHVDAWGVGLERWLIDRIEIAVPPDTAPGAEKRAIDPARYIEDWAVLPGLLETFYPVEGGAFELRPRAMIVDTGGAAGVTQNAYKFYRQQRKAGNGKRFYLAKGIGGLGRDRAEYKEPEKVLQRKTGRRSDIKLVYVGTDKLKDEVTLSLTRAEAGPGKYHLSSFLDARVFSEFCAEIRTDDGWEKRRANLPNEALDLGCYGKALAIVLKAEQIDWAKPQTWADWALPAPENANARATSLHDTASTAHQAPAVPAASKPSSKPKRRGGGFVSRRY